MARRSTPAARLRRLLVGPDPAPATCYATRRVFLSLLGVIYAVAFASLWAQVHGLIGSEGVLPARDYLAGAAAELGGAAWHRVPTVLWVGASDAALHALCAAGVGVGVALALGLAPLPCLALLWALYLSAVAVGGIFFGYQWDGLLLECGLLAIFFAPTGLRPDWRGGTPPSRLVLLLLRWLLFRLMFLSGAGKLLSGDPTWADGTALEYHYWTQPLPHLGSYLAHQLPAAFHRLSTAATLAIEGIVPFLVFGPRRLRRLAFAAFAGLLLLIVLTGNYGFFEPLALVLCLCLLDDRDLHALRPRRWRGKAPTPPPAPPARVGPRSVLTAAFAACALLLSAVPTGQRLGLWSEPPEALRPLVRLAGPLRSFNGYGLFTVMTTTRPEIVVEGSRDGREWRAYEFRWKPGRLDRPPGWTALHMPRLDWQMWFAALGGGRPASWYPAFVLRLLEGSPWVLGLLEANPFPDGPPRYVRSTRFRYRFTTPAERAASGRWWRRERPGPYGPTLELVAGRLQRVR